MTTTEENIPEGAAPAATSRPDQGLAARLDRCRQAIRNAHAEPVIKAALAEFGYDEARLAEGEALLAETEAAFLAYAKEQAEATAAIRDKMNARSQAEAEYMTHLKIARLAMKDDPAAASALRLRGTRARSLAGWLKQARLFYDGLLANPTWITAMGRYGQTQERLESGRDRIHAVEDAYIAQLRESGEAQEATLSRNEALDAAERWRSELLTIAELALTDHPQRLEALGVRVPA